MMSSKDFLYERGYVFGYPGAPQMSRARLFERSAFHLCLFLAVRYPLSGAIASTAWKWFALCCVVNLVWGLATKSPRVSRDTQFGIGEHP
jgi:hypothetical protein